MLTETISKIFCQSLKESEKEERENRKLEKKKRISSPNIQTYIIYTCICIVIHDRYETKERNIKEICKALPRQGILYFINYI